MEQNRPIWHWVVFWIAFGAILGALARGLTGHPEWLLVALVVVILATAFFLTSRPQPRPPTEEERQAAMGYDSHFEGDPRYKTPPGLDDLNDDQNRRRLR